MHAAMRMPRTNARAMPCMRACMRCAHKRWYRLEDVAEGLRPGKGRPSRRKGVRPRMRLIGLRALSRRVAACGAARPHQTVAMQRGCVRVALRRPLGRVKAGARPGRHRCSTRDVSAARACSGKPATARKCPVTPAAFRLAAMSIDEVGITRARLAVACEAQNARVSRSSPSSAKAGTSGARLSMRRDPRANPSGMASRSAHAPPPPC